jgi:hypothetical protein
MAPEHTHYERDTLTAMANLAVTYRQQGRAKEAEELEVTGGLSLTTLGLAESGRQLPWTELKETCGACGQRLRNSL